MGFCWFSAFRIAPHDIVIVYGSDTHTQTHTDTRTQTHTDTDLKQNVRASMWCETTGP